MLLKATFGNLPRDGGIPSCMDSIIPSVETCLYIPLSRGKVEQGNPLNEGKSDVIFLGESG